MKYGPSLFSILTASALTLGCTPDDGASTGTNTESSATTITSTSASSSGDPSASASASSSSGATSDATEATSDTTETDETMTTTGFVPTVGDGVFLYTGSGGDNYDTDAAALESLYTNAGIPVTRSDVIDGDVSEEHGCLVLLNPRDSLPPQVVDAAQAMVDGGGRVVFQTEHSGYGGHEIANAVLEGLGSSLRSLPESRSGWATVDIASAPPLTDGVGELSPFFVARVEVGAGEAIATLTGEDWVVIARESVGEGEVVVVTDGSMFGYSLDSGDNERFILNFAEL